MTWINRNGITILGLRASLDIDDQQPVDNDTEVAVDFASMEYSNEAQLIVNYTIGKQPLPCFFRKTT